MDVGPKDGQPGSDVSCRQDGELMAASTFERLALGSGSARGWAHIGVIRARKVYFNFRGDFAPADVACRRVELAPSRTPRSPPL